MAFAKATLISRIRRRLNDDPWHDICTEAMDTTETDLSVADTTKWAVGDIVEFQDDGEQCLVTVLTSSTVLTVIRAVNGSPSATPGTGTTHAINGDIVKNPVYQYIQIEQAISAAIAELWPYVYKKITTSVTPLTTGENYYSVAATVEGISSAVQLSTATVDKPQFYGLRRSAYPIELVVGLPDNFPGTEDTGKAVWIPRTYNTTNAILVNGIGRITDTVATSSYSDLTDGNEVQCVVYFALAELVASTDIIRSTGTDTSMNDQSVSPGRRSQLSEVWYQKGLRRRRQWEMDLHTSLPKLPSYRKVV